jgi:hypothetical protein
MLQTPCTRAELAPHFAIGDRLVATLLQELEAKHGTVPPGLRVRLELLGLQATAAAFVRAEALRTGERALLVDVAAIAADIRSSTEAIRQAAAVPEDSAAVEATEARSAP